MTRTIHLGSLTVIDFGDDGDQFHLKIETRKGNIVIAESPQAGVDEITVELAEEGSQKQLTFSPEDFAMFSDSDGDGGVDTEAVAQAVRDQAPSTEAEPTTSAPPGDGERAETSLLSTAATPEGEPAGEGGAEVKAETPTLDNETTTDDGGDASSQADASAPPAATDGGEKPNERADDANGSAEGADADTFM